MRTHATPLPPDVPAESSALDIAVPVALATLFGVGVGIVLGRTVLAPKTLPVATIHYVPKAGPEESVPPAGALIEEAREVEQPSSWPVHVQQAVAQALGRDTADLNRLLWRH